MKEHAPMVRWVEIGASMGRLGAIGDHGGRFVMHSVGEWGICCCTLPAIMQLRKLAERGRI